MCLKEQTNIFFNKKPSLEQLKHYFKAGLHYGDYHSKLVPFEEQKNMLYIKKGPSLEQ